MMRRTVVTATASRQRRKELMVDARINSCRVLVDGTRHDGRCRPRSRGKIATEFNKITRTIAKQRLLICATRAIASVRLPSRYTGNLGGGPIVDGRGCRSRRIGARWG